METDSNDTTSVLHQYLLDPDGDVDEIGENLMMEDGDKSGWKGMKARIQTQARSRNQIQPLEHRVSYFYFNCFFLSINIIKLSISQILMTKHSFQISD
jgi:hypothetical protein